MSWASVTTTGSGKLRWRLALEGWPYGFVTDADMELTTSDVSYVVGLVGDSIVIEESVDLAYASLDVAGMTLRIVDVDGNATRAFATRPTKRAWLTTDIPSTGSPGTMVVTSTAGWTTDDLAHIDTEALNITTIVDGTQMSYTRPTANSIAQKHFANDGDLLRSAVVTDKPQTLEGRRAWIYAYADADTVPGPGTLVWSGICASDARLVDGVEWELSIDPITRLWKTDLGSDLELPVTPRGIEYNHTGPLRVAVIEHSGANYTDSAGATAAAEVGVPTIGFYENQTAFLSALNADLATMDGTWAAGNTIRAVEDEDGGWHLVVSITTARYYTVLASSPIDGSTMPFLWESDGDRSTTVAAGTYHVRWQPDAGPPGARLVPRGMVGPAPSWWMSGHLAGELRRIYLGGDIAVSSALTGAVIRWGDDGTEQSYAIAAADVDATNRYVQLEQVGIVSSPQWHVWTPALLPEIKFARTYVDSGDVADLRDALVTNGPDVCNRGGGPLLSATYDHASWTATVAEAAAAAGPAAAYLQNRRYYYARPVKLDDVLTHEFRLLGVYPCLDANGLIQLRRLTVSTPDDVASATIDASNVLLDRAWPGWERTPFGSINTVSMHPRWDAMSDRFDGPPITIIDASAYGMSKAPRVLEIKPRSQCVAALAGRSGGIIVAAPYSAIAAQASVALGIFGSPYAVATIDVPFALFGVLVGQTVTLTNAQLPDWAGGRGLTSAQALVIGRRWSVEEGGGTLTLLLHGLDVAGYAPTARISSKVNVTGNQWDLTIDAAWYMPSGAVLSDFWAAGDRVQVQRWDSTTLSTLTGTIDSVTDGSVVIRVTFTAVWTPGGFTWDLMYQDANAAGLQAGQQTYAYVADSAARIQFATTQAARQYAP